MGITGSAGETSTKDLIADQAGPTLATSRSLNNEIGLPVTISRADAATAYLVLEMGLAVWATSVTSPRSPRPRSPP